MSTDPLSLSRTNYTEAILTNDGILLKTQAPTTNLYGSESESGSNGTSIPFIGGCFTCLDSDLDNDPSAMGLLPNFTVIPFRRILNARFISDSDPEDNDNSSNTELENPFENVNKNNFTESYKKLNSLVELTFVVPKNGDIIPKKISLSIQTIPTVEGSSNNRKNNENNENGIDNNNADTDETENVVESILRKSFKGIKRDKSILVVINPHGGRGKAKKLYETKCNPILAATECKIDIAYTKYSCHAMDIARDLDISKYDTIACASGDGIPYEIINGLYQRPDRVDAFNRLTITQLPCGSGNAMSISCHWTNNPSYATLCLVKSIESRIDIMCCSQKSYVDQFPRLSFLSQTYGVIAESDINTEFMRWMGPSRFELGVAFTVLQGRKYPCDLYVKYAIKNKDDIHIHYIEHKNRTTLLFDQDIDINQPRNQFATDNDITEDSFKLKYNLDDNIPSDWEKVDTDITNNLQIFYTGKMPYMANETKFFPAALPSDGTFDMVITDSRTPLTKITPILLSLDKGTHVLQPEVIHAKVLAYRLVPKIENGLFSVDGENFPLETLQVEILPGLVKTLLVDGSYIDSEFDSMI